MSKGAEKGMIAIVTGAGSGIGRAIARRLAADGATVAVNDLRETPRLTQLADELGAITAPADVSDHAAIAAAVDRVEERLGRPVDLLVANAALEQMGDFLEQEEAEIFDQVDVNLTGTYACIQAVLPGMRRAGGGAIVVITSIWGITGWPRAAAYSASKAGTISLTKALGRELAPERIRVNAIAPGVIDSPQIEVDAADAGMSLDDLREMYASRTALKRVGQPAEIAALVAFLGGPAAEGYAGQVLQPNGGAQLGWA
ncbi:MAG TPA: SDR family oxidoreductase [Conexibacter sp.]|nr:SDR family oxidoreductase [Conexibacter sp.]